MMRRRLGRDGPEVSAIGVGTMGMTGTYGQVDAAEAERTLHRALELGLDVIDCAEAYGPFTNEEFVGRALEGRRGRAFLCTKFAFGFDGARRLDLDGSPANVRRAIEGSLKRLRTDRIDLWYQHRVDPKVPIEETTAAMAREVAAGKVRFIGFSEIGEANLRRAHAVHRVTAVQSEFSLWEREPWQRMAPVLRELGIGFVPYCPLGRGFLAGSARPAQEYPADDYRRLDPRFQGENYRANQRIAEAVGTIARRLGVSPARVALAWLLAQDPTIVPIPGTERREFLDDNARAPLLALAPADRAALDALVPAAGARWPEAWAAQIDR